MDIDTVIESSRRRSARITESAAGAAHPSGERVGFGSGSARLSNYSTKEMEARRDSSRQRGDSSTSKTRVSGTSADGERDPSKESPKESKVNWKRYVTLNPPNLVKFDMVESDRQRIKPLQGDRRSASASEDAQDDLIDAADAKAESFIEILNKSDHYILFKVKTTNIQNYVVRPNADIIPSDYSMKVRVVTQYSLSVSYLLFFHLRVLISLFFMNLALQNHRQRQVLGANGAGRLRVDSRMGQGENHERPAEPRRDFDDLGPDRQEAAGVLQAQGRC